MAVDRDEVLRAAALARLELSDDEVESLARDLAGILAHVEALGGADDGAAAADVPAADFEGTAAGGSGGRGDEPGSDSLSGGVDGIAPDFRDEFFVVPRLASHDTSSDPDPGGHTHTHRHRERP